MQTILGILKHPKVILASIAVGALLGIYNPALSKQLSPVSAIFISLLNMCAIPIMIIMIVLSIARLLKSPQAGGYLAAFAAFCAAGALCTCIFGAALGLLSDFLLSDMRSALSRLLAASNTASVAAPMPIKDLLYGIVPPNVFRALAEGHLMSLMFFFILFGIALGCDKARHGNMVLATLEGVGNAFFRIIDWFIYLLPIALCAVFAQLFSRYGADTIYSLGGLLTLCLAGCLLIIFAYLTVIFIVYGKAAPQVVASLQEAFLVGFGTTSSLAAMPFALKAIEKNFNIRNRLGETIYPLAAIFNVQVTVFFVTMATVIICHAYGVHIGAREAAIIFLGSVTFSLCGAGLPGVVSVAMLSVIFNPLGLPLETASVLFLVLIPLVDPILTVAVILGNCTAAVLVDKWTENPQET